MITSSGSDEIYTVTDDSSQMILVLPRRLDIIVLQGSREEFGGMRTVRPNTWKNDTCDLHLWH